MIMKKLSFEFTVDKANKQIQVEREFNASGSLVWKAWTRPEILDRWWAPKPYRAETKSQEFTEGGRWLYSMISPEGEKHWSLAEYQKIHPETFLSWLDAFCDDSGNINAEKPRSLWDIHFKETAGITLVEVILEHQSEADVDTMLRMGFKEGFSMGLDNLEALLPAL